MRGRKLYEEYEPTEEDWKDFGEWSDSLPKTYPQPEEYGLDHDGNRLVKRGDKVMLFGKYPAVVVEDEDLDNDKIKLTKPDALDTEEEEVYADWFDKKIIDKSEDMVSDDEDNIEINENHMKKNTIKLNEGQLRAKIEEMVRKTLLREVEEEMGGDIAGLPSDEEASEEIDPEKVAMRVIDYALTKDKPGREYITQEKRDALMAEELDDAIIKWAQATLAKNQRESEAGNAEPFHNEDDMFEHMINSGSYKRFFYTVKSQRLQVKRGTMSPEEMNHHQGEKPKEPKGPSFLERQRKKTDLSEAIAKGIKEALKKY